MKKLALLLFVCLTAYSQNPNTATYPSAIATDTELLAAKDRSSSTLSSDINNSTLTIPVVDGSNFIVSEVITIDSEQLLITNIVVNDLTVAGRGFDWTDAASHLADATVRGQVVAYGQNQAAAEIKAIETALGTNLGNVAQLGATPSNAKYIICTHSSGKIYECPSTGTSQLGTKWFFDSTNLRFSAGGTSASFPAWVRNGTEWQAKLADNSDYAPIRVGEIVVRSEATGQQTKINFLDGATQKWYFGKAGDNTFFIFDFAATQDIMTVATGNGPNFPQGASSTVFDASTGFQIGSTAAAGNYLRGNATNFVSAAIQDGDIPAALARDSEIVLGRGNLTVANYMVCTSAAGTVKLCNVNLTFGANDQASLAVTFDVTGSVDPVLTFSDGVTNVSAGVLQVGGVVVVDLTSVQSPTNKTLDGVDAGAGTTRANEVKLLTARHNTDCTSLTDGVAGELCYEEDANTLYMCEPSAGGCDTGAEWILTSGTGAGIVWDTMANLPGGSSADDMAGVNDGADPEDCDTGGGSTRVICTYDGAAWRPSAGTTVAGASGALAITMSGLERSIDIVPAVSPTKAAATVWAGNNDFGGATGLEAPNGAAPTVNAAGEFAIDTTVADMTSIMRMYGAEELALIPVPIAEIASLTDGDVIAYDAAANEFVIEAQAGGGSAITPDPTRVVAWEEFCGIAGKDLGWDYAHVNGAGGSETANMVGEADHPCLHRIASGTTSDRGGSYYWGASVAYTMFDIADISANEFRLEMIFRAQDIPSNKILQVGMFQFMARHPAQANNNDQICIEYQSDADTNWYFKTRNDTTETRVDSSIAAGNTNWHRVVIWRNSGDTANQYRFCMDACGSSSTLTTNVPNVSLNIGFRILQDADGTTSQDMDMDWVGFTLEGLSRW